MRTLRIDDLDAIVTLAQRAFPFDELNRSYLSERIWGDPDCESDLLLGQWNGERLAAFMIGVTRITKSGRTGYIKLFATDPEMRGQGLASELLSQMEMRLAGKGVRQILVSGCAPWYIFAGVDVRYTPALIMLQKAGYSNVGDAVNMLVDLHALPLPNAALLDRPQQHGIQLRRMKPGDAGAFVAWAKATWNENWAVEGLMALEHKPVSAFLALQDDAIVGFAAYDGARPGWFGPMGTTNQLRGQGIGGALYLLCLEDMRRQGYAQAEISWAGPTAFYSKLSGAYIHRVFRRWKKELPAFGG